MTWRTKQRIFSLELIFYDDYYCGAAVKSWNRVCKSGLASLYSGISELGEVNEVYLNK